MKNRFDLSMAKKADEALNRTASDIPYNSTNVKAALDGHGEDIDELLTNYQSAPIKESAQLGMELIDETGWTLGANWTGNTNTGFVHTPGSVEPLSRIMAETGTNLYQIEFDVSTPLISGELTVSIGNSTPFDLYIGAETHQSIGIMSISNGNLIITPISGFSKTINNISIKQITGAYEATQKITDSNSNTTFEIRANTINKYNQYIGVNSGRYNTSGYSNLGIGNNSMSKNTSGFWNVGIGKDSLKENTVGSRNVGIGYGTLLNNKSGQRNIGIGSFALTANTYGNKNVAVGSDVMYQSTTASNNIGVGFGALAQCTTGNYNVAVGDAALGSQNIAGGNVAIGALALAMCTGGENSAIGFNAGSGNTTGVDNTIIGYYAGGGLGSGAINRNVIIGNLAGRYLTAGANNNTFIGNRAGSNITTGAGNILIGNLIDAPSATTSNYLNIGNVITGNLSTKVVSMENLILSNIPTTDPNVAGQVWNNSNILTISTG